MFELCAPSLIYLIFSATQIIIDTFKGLYNTAFFKLIVSIIITILLNTLCDKGLGIISWIIVFIPFMFMSVIVTILLYVFGLDVATGKMNTHIQEEKIQKIKKPEKHHCKEKIQKHENHCEERNNRQNRYNSPSPVEIFNPNYNASSYYPFFQEQQPHRQPPYQPINGRQYQPGPPYRQVNEPQPHNIHSTSYQSVTPQHLETQPTILYIPPNTN